jgi:hypothetical protein
LPRPQSIKTAPTNYQNKALRKKVNQDQKETIQEEQGSKKAKQKGKTTVDNRNSSEAGGESFSLIFEVSIVFRVQSSIGILIPTDGAD